MYTKCDLVHGYLIEFGSDMLINPSSPWGEHCATVNLHCISPVSTNGELTSVLVGYWVSRLKSGPGVNLMLIGEIPH